MKESQEARRLWPHLLPYVEKARPYNVILRVNGEAIYLGTPGGGGGTIEFTGGAPSPHNLSSEHHQGTLADSQAPQFLKLDGTRTLTGDLEVATGITLDGVDLDVHAADPDAHHLRATAGQGIIVTGQTVAVDLAPLSGLNFVSGDLNIDKAFAFTWSNVHHFDATPQIDANLAFVGGHRTVTASDNLTLAPDDDLWITPGGMIMLNDSGELRTSTIIDLPTGIQGIRLWERDDATNYWQLTMGAAKFDELYARVFVADETRVDRGEEYWSKSFGIVESNFFVPALNTTVDVWFENSPALAGASLFSVGDWLLMRVIDWGTGLLIMKAWFQVHSLIVPGTVDGQRQQWRIMRKKFGTTGVEVKKGSTILDAGVPGQGWLHLSALNQDGGPFFQVGVFTEVIDDEPQFVPYTRMGNLEGTVDYSDRAWGFVTGSNLGASPEAGFSGIVSEAEQGIRIFNADIRMYDSALLAVSLTRDAGLALLRDESAWDNANRSITWYDALDDDGSHGTVMASIQTWGTSDDSRLQMAAFGAAMTHVGLDTGSASLGLYDGSGWGAPSDGLISLGAGSVRIIGGFGVGDSVRPKFRVGGDNSSHAVSGIHLFENSPDTDKETGITIEKAGTGDALLHWYLSLGQRFVAGIDRSDGNKFKISAGGSLGILDAIVIDPTTGVVTINGLSGSGTGSVTLNANDGLNLVGTDLSVDATVVRTSRTVTAGDGLQGGGTLDANISLSVNSSVVRTTRQINTGAGLTGGGNLGSNRTLSILLPTLSGLETIAGGLQIKDSIAGDGLDILNKVLSVDDTVVRTERFVIAGDGLDGGGALATDVTLNVDATVVRTARTLFAGAGMQGGGNLSANRTFAIRLATASGLNVADGLAVDASLGGDGLTVTDGVMDVDNTVVRITRQVNTTGPLSGGGDLSAHRTLSLTLASPSALNIENGLAVDDSLAGAGLLIDEKVMRVDPGAGLTFAANEVIVDEQHSFDWLGDHTWNGAVARFILDPEIVGDLDFTGAARSIRAESNLTLIPQGDLVLSPGGDSVLPAGSIDIDLGAYNRRWRTLYAAELYTETLVAQHVLATIGGRVMVAPTTSLQVDVGVTDEQIIVKHNNLVNGGYVLLEAVVGGSPQFEVMKVISDPTTVPEGYRYDVERNVDGTNPPEAAWDAWAAGDALVYIGAGYIDLTSTATVHNHLGPTITIYARASNGTWDDVAPVTSMGNLESFVDYGSAEYGFAVGNDLTLDASTGFSGLTADRTNGLRLYNTAYRAYLAGDPIISLDNDSGLAIQMSTDTLFANARRIAFYTDLENQTAATQVMLLRVNRAGVSPPEGILSIGNSTLGGSFTLNTPSAEIEITQGGGIILSNAGASLALDDDFLHVHGVGNPGFGLYVDTNSDEVGIKTNAPAAALHVAGDIIAEDGIKIGASGSVLTLYLEGATAQWTPTFITDANFVYNASGAASMFRRLGDMVHFQADVIFLNASGNATAARARLPYTSHASLHQVIGCMLFDVGGVNRQAGQAWIQPNTNYATLFGASSGEISGSEITASSRVVWGGTYRIAPT